MPPLVLVFLYYLIITLCLGQITPPNRPLKIERRYLGILALILSSLPMIIRLRLGMNQHFSHFRAFEF